jgi:hypothetical protein
MEKNIYKRLSESKSEFGKLVKDANNPFFKSKYLSLNALLSTIEPVLLSNNLLLLQPIEDGKVVTRIISIGDGTEVKSEIEIPKNADPQKLGSAITYLRRYGLQSLFGLQAEDDDGNAAAAGARGKKVLTEEQFNKLLLKENHKHIGAYIEKFQMKPAQLVELTKLMESCND